MGSYEQYKLDTKRFILWLVVTAREFGHEIRDPAVSLQEITLQQPSISGSIVSKAKYDITTDEILELAEYIKNQNMTATMPRFVLLSHKRAVKTREAYAQRYATEELRFKESNDGHTYFLSVLKQCFELIKENIKIQSAGRPTTFTSASSRYNLSTSSQSSETLAQVSIAVLPTSSATEASDLAMNEATVAETEQAEQAEHEAKGHQLDELARKFELDMKTMAREDLAMRKSCLSDDMRKVVEQLEDYWHDTIKESTDKDYLDNIRATLMTEAALDLIRDQEEVLIQETHEKGLGEFDSSLVTDEFFGKTARSVTRINRERRDNLSQPYPFSISRPSVQEIATLGLHSEEDYEFLLQYLLETIVLADVRKKFHAIFKLPLLKGALDTFSDLYAELVGFMKCSIATVFMAELAIRIRAKDTKNFLKYFLPLAVRAQKDESQFVAWQDNGIQFSDDIIDYSRGLRAYIINRPSSRMRYTRMRLLSSINPLCGLQRDYPRPKFKTQEDRDFFMHKFEAVGVPDSAGDQALRQATAARIILPAQDGDFLLKAIPTSPGKLSLVYSLLYELTGIRFANASPQIFSICHLYNCFHKRGFITGNWPELEVMMDWHVDKIFLKEIPTRPEEFFSRMLLAAGFSTDKIKKARDLKEDPDRQIPLGKSTHKNPALESPMTTKILIDYIFGNETGTRTWHRLNEEMARSSGTSSRTQDNSDLSILSFVNKLRNSEKLGQALSRLQFDYIGLTLQCNEIFHKIDLEQAKLASGEPALPEKAWRSPTARGFSLVSTILGDLDRTVLFKDRSSKKAKNMPDQTAIVQVAVREMQRFVNGLSQKR